MQEALDVLTEWKRAHAHVIHSNAQTLQNIHRLVNRPIAATDGNNADIAASGGVDDSSAQEPGGRFVDDRSEFSIELARIALFICGVHGGGGGRGVGSGVACGAL